MGCLTFVQAAKQVTVRGIVLNSQSDSIGLYDALGRVKEPLEMAKVDSKGNFKFYFAPAEIGYYMLQCKGGKGALCVLKPESAINITVDARTGMIVNAENSKENQMFHDYQAFLITLEYYKDSLVRAHQETPNPNIQQQMQQLEMRRVQYLGIPLSWSWKEPLSRQLTVYATGTLALHLPLHSTTESVWMLNGQPVDPTTTHLHPGVQWSVGLGLGIRYQLAPHISLFAEPRLHHYFNNGSGVETWNTAHPITFSLPFGLQITW